MTGPEEKKKQTLEEIIELDKDMHRILEDLLNVFLKKGMIKMSDFSEEAQIKINKRLALRKNL